MPDSHRPIAIKARYVFPVTSAPIQDGIVTIEDNRIVAVGTQTAGLKCRDLGNVALLPGFINAHTHLEFSDIESPIGTPGMPFPDWVRQVIDHRRAAHDDKKEPVAVGLKQITALGTVAVGEIAQPDWPVELFDSDSTDCTVMLELIGRSNEQIENCMQLAAEHIRRGTSTDSNWRPGLSPHAPYSIHLDLLSRVCSLSADHKIPVAMHLAESMDELELLASGSGPMRQLLDDLDAWHPGAIPRGIEPLDYLQILASAHRALVIHGNFLSDGEIDFLGQHSANMSAVYCPRTHAYFQHGEYPLGHMLAAGVNVALGTDSRASNPDLNLLDEMRFARRTHPDVQPDVVLRMGTLAGATALGIDTELGSISPGKRAALVAVQIGDKDTEDPHELLFETNAPATIVTCAAESAD